MPRWRKWKTARRTGKPHQRKVLPLPAWRPPDRRTTRSPKRQAKHLRSRTTCCSRSRRRPARRTRQQSALRWKQQQTEKTRNRTSSCSSNRRQGWRRQSPSSCWLPAWMPFPAWPSRRGGRGRRRRRRGTAGRRRSGLRSADFLGLQVDGHRLAPGAGRALGVGRFRIARFRVSGFRSGAPGVRLLAVGSHERSLPWVLHRAGFRHGASIARPAASLPLTPLSMFAALAVQNKFAPWRVSPQAKKSFQRPHITPAARP